MSRGLKSGSGTGAFCFVVGVTSSPYQNADQFSQWNQMFKTSEYQGHLPGGVDGACAAPANESASRSGTLGAGLPH